MRHIVGIGLESGEKIQVLQISLLLDPSPDIVSLMRGDHLLDGTVDKPVHEENSLLSKI